MKQDSRKLVFSNSDLVLVLAHSDKATTWKNDLSEAIARWQEMNPGKVWDFNITLTQEHYRRTKPSLWFVKDSGIYVMTSANLPAIPLDRSHVAYALGFGPDAPYDKIVDAVGGDDFVHAFDLEEGLVDAIKKGFDMVIEFSHTQMAITMQKLNPGHAWYEVTFFDKENNDYNTRTVQLTEQQYQDTLAEIKRKDVIVNQPILGKHMTVIVDDIQKL